MEKALFGLPMVCDLSLCVIVSRYRDDSFGWDSLPLSGPRECPFAFFFHALVQYQLSSGKPSSMNQITPVESFMFEFCL
jgi:hypothetical protein